ncbi:MAG: glycosyltransferase family 2 protein [Candidatus Kapaibacterium sp.]
MENLINDQSYISRIINIKRDKSIVVVIPAYNEEKSILKVVNDIPKSLVDEIVVVDNNSNDNTVSIAKGFGATVLSEKKKGYGAACLTGVRYALEKKFDIVVFLDADYSDFPEEIYKLIEPITKDNIDLVIGSRNLGGAQSGALLPHAIFGNMLATYLINLMFKMKFSDLGPFRAIRSESLFKLNMKDLNYGWTVEMQVKAAKLKMKCSEVSVSYRSRIGDSKISGTISGSLKAGLKILYIIFKYAF